MSHLSKTSAIATGNKEHAAATEYDYDDVSADLVQRREIIQQSIAGYAEFIRKMQVSSGEEIRAIVEGAKFIKLDPDEISGWEKFLVESEESAKALASQKQKINDLLNAAQQNKSIAERVIKEYEGKMEDPTLNFKERESYILRVLDVLPDRIKEWKDVADKQKKLAENPAVKFLTSADVPKIDVFRDREKFLNLPYPERRALVDEVQAVLNVRKMQQEHLYTDIRKELELWAKQGFMHASKVDVWLLRIFNGTRSMADVGKFMGTVVRPHMNRWAVTRKEFDRLEDAFEKDDVPRGLRRLTLDQFLLLSYKKKTSYLSLAWARMDDPDGSLEQNKELSALKLRARHQLDIEDWEDAEMELNKAFAIAPYDPELISMRDFLTAHRSKIKEKKEQKEDPDPHQILQEMREIVTAVPSPLQTLYQQALADGPAVFGRLTQVVYNRVWLHDVAGWNEEIERERIAYLRATKQQGKGILLDLNTQNSDAMLHQIRDHADEKAGKTPPGLSADEHWGYWTSIIPQDVTVGRQREIVRNDHYRLKRGLRTLRQMGYVYTASGSLTRQNGTVAA